MKRIVSASPRGRAIDLLAPRVDQVDFPEIASALAGINRYAGCVAVVTQPVSVALHTLIALDAARAIGQPVDVLPYVLLHDAPEARLGDQIRPWKRALHAELTARLGERLADEVELAAHAIHHRHFEVICEAAGLAPPDERALEFVKAADDLALVTERFWFLPAADEAWGRSLAHVAPMKKRPRWLPADKAADALMERMRQLLPVYRKHAA